MNDDPRMEYSSCDPATCEVCLRLARADAAPRRGIVTRERTAWCGVCGHWSQFSGSAPAAKKYWLAIGWQHTRRLGWRCPSCATHLLSGTARG